MQLNVKKLMAQCFADSTAGLAPCIYLELPWPPSLNHSWRVSPRGVYLQKHVAMYRRNVLGIVQKALMRRAIPFKPVECPVAVMMEYRRPSKRRVDIDNLSKQVFDSLTRSNVWRDDSQVDLVLKYFGSTVKGGAVSVLIQPLEV